MPSHRASTVRWAILRNVFLSLAKTCSMEIEVRTVGGQEALRRPGGFDGFSNAGAFMGTEIIHHHDFARRQGRHQNLLDIGEELCAVNGTVEDTRSGDAIVAQRRQKGRRLPVAERGVSDKSLASFTSPIARCHVGRGPGLIDEYKPLRIKTFLLIAPSETCGPDIRSFLFGGVQSFF